MLMRQPAELEKVETAFINILGLKPLYFRPPYGNINDLALQVLGQRGYKSESVLIGTIPLALLPRSITPYHSGCGLLCLFLAR